MLVLLVAGVYGLLPRLGDLRAEAEALRHAPLVLVAAAVAAQAASLLLYILFYRRVLDAMGAAVNREAGTGRRPDQTGTVGAQAPTARIADTR